MNSTDPISQEQLNAFLDNELEDEERAQILAALRTDPELSAEFAHLQQINELVSFAYHDIPLKNQRQSEQQLHNAKPLRIAAVVAMLVFGTVLGWMLHKPQSALSTLPFTNLSQLNLKQPVDNKILIHINAMDDRRINNVLTDTEKLLANAKHTGNPLQLEIVANASGLGMLRKGSPYTRRIHRIVAANSNVAFLACGFAMENARLKEGHAIQLIPDAHKVDAALEQILRRLKAGWLYVRA